jgi:E3 ubiquitin-protein ligase DOA10
MSQEGQQQKNEECFICYDTEQGKKIQPCPVCKGSCGTVHVGCWIDYIRTSVDYLCPVCKTPYRPREEEDNDHVAVVHVYPPEIIYHQRNRRGHSANCLYFCVGMLFSFFVVLEVVTFILVFPNEISSIVNATMEFYNGITPCSIDVIIKGMRRLIEGSPEVD